MSDRALIRQEEARFLKAAQRVLLQGGFPNPERTGCPDKSVLRAIASREINPEQMMDWIGHLGFCSPCYCEYALLRRHVKTRQWVRLAAISACITYCYLSGFGFRLGGGNMRSGQEVTLLAGKRPALTRLVSLIFEVGSCCAVKDPPPMKLL